MSKKYKFKHDDMIFSKDGQLDELIALDRYAVSSFDGYGMGDTVVAIVDKAKGTKQVGEITGILNDGEIFEIKTRLGEVHTVSRNLLQRPLETEPHQLWSRWAKGGASVEKTPELKEWFENELRWLFDGYRYSLGGRIQLMLGQEFVTGKRANLTAYNCYVVRSPYHTTNPKAQFLDVVEVAFKEASIMRRGGGVGLNISTIASVSGSKAKEGDFVFYLDNEHPDYEELLDREQLSKLEGVQLIADRSNWDDMLEEENVRFINAIDSVDGLFTNLKDMVSASYDGMTVAINFNHLRERNAIVKGVNGRSSGSVSWMELFILIANLLQQEVIDNVDFAEIFSEIVHLIIQGGSRRGALMLICNDDNPNVYKFMQRKKVAGYLSGANISVGVSDEFMHLVMTGKQSKKNRRLLSSDQDKAVELWDILIESAWTSAEPGIVWLERYNKESNSWYFHEIVATNPCGEQGLPAFGVCNLGHIVLSAFYDKTNNDINWKDLERAVKIAIRLQDNIIDYTDYFLEENKAVQLAERRVGMGSLGLGTLLIQMGLAYGSDEGNEFTDKLYSTIARVAYETSIELAEEKGSFQKFDYHNFIESGFMKRLLERFPHLDGGLKKHGIRNVTLLTQAPTGSTGTYIDNIPLFRERFGGTTTGVEPYYNWEYWRAGRLGMSKQTVHLAEQYMKEHNLKDVSELPSFFVNAMDLQPIDHVKVQAAIQKWTDSSISKTANCPSDFTIEQTDELYLESYKLGLKGMTIYRDGSRDAQVLATNEKDAKLETHIEAEKLAKLKEGKVAVDFVTEGDPIPEQSGNVVHTDDSKFVLDFLSDESMEKAKKLLSNPSVSVISSKEEVEFIKPIIKKVPSRLFGMREKVRYQSGDTMSKAYVHIYVDSEGTPVEVWIEPTDVRDKDMADALGRMTTQFLRFGNTSNNVDQAVKHLKTGKMMMSLPAIIGRLLNDIYYGKIEMPTFAKADEPKPKKEFGMTECSECGAKAYDKANCLCHACGQSKCN